MRAHRYAYAIMPALAAILLAGSSVPARAQVRYPDRGVYDVRDQAYENGYRRGYENGLGDARSGRPSEFRNDREYRDGDWGYDGRDGSRDNYRRTFRGGFEVGYRDGYSGRAGNRPTGVYGGIYGGTYGRTLPPGAGYPDQRDQRDVRRGPGGYGGYGGSAQVAFNFGYNDGYERGAKAGRDRKRFDPNREGWYRDGDRHYDRDYGPRDRYKVTYREGFLRGYEEGYNSVGYGGYYRR